MFSFLFVHYIFKLHILYTSIFHRLVKMWVVVFLLEQSSGLSFFQELLSRLCWWTSHFYHSCVCADTWAVSSHCDSRGCEQEVLRYVFFGLTPLKTQRCSHLEEAEKMVPKSSRRQKERQRKVCPESCRFQSGEPGSWGEGDVSQGTAIINLFYVQCMKCDLLADSSLVDEKNMKILLISFT